MTVKAKFEVTKVSEFGYAGKRQEVTKLSVEKSTPGHSVYESTGIPVREIAMSAVYGSTGEDASFAESTPTGTITFTLSNPACVDEFKAGDIYYVTFTRKED